jgi:hypothetical protein
LTTAPRTREYCNRLIIAFCQLLLIFFIVRFPGLEFKISSGLEYSAKRLIETDTHPTDRKMARIGRRDARREISGIVGPRLATNEGMMPRRTAALASFAFSSSGKIG